MLRLLTLGRSDLFTDSPADEAGPAVQPKQFALLVFLAVDAGGAFHRRDTLVAVFWPDCDDAHARAALRKSLHHLRRALGAAAIVTRGIEDVRVSPQLLWCDAQALRALSAEARHADAIALYNGEFLPGMHLSDAPEFEHWVSAQRLGLRSIALQCSLTLARANHEGRQTGLAVRWARRAVDIAPLDESANRALIEALDANADRVGAISAFDGFSSLLARELDLGPDIALCAMADRLRASIPVLHAGRVGAPMQ